MALNYISKYGYPELSPEFNSQNQTYVSVYSDDINRQLVFIDEKTDTELYRIPDTTADAVIVLGAGTGSSYRCGNSNNSSGDYSTISGGFGNTAAGSYATISGGYNNNVSGNCSAILGGFNNNVTGCYSGAMGCGLTASADYTFYANNFCACGSYHTSSILTGRSVCVGGVNGDELVGYIPTFPIAYNTVQEEGGNLPQRTTINFVGAGVVASDFGGVTTVNIPGGGGPAAYPTIQDEGVSLPIQPIIDFVGAGVTAANGVGKTIITIPGGGGPANFYGSFYDTTTQSAVAINTPYPMNLNTTDLSNGVTIVNDILGNPTQITAVNSGIYNIAFSAQLQRSSGGNTQTIDIWLRKNGVDVPDSATKVNVQANAGFLVVAWNFFANLNAGDYVQLMWLTTATTITIQYSPANLIIPIPAIPSLILTINRIS